MTRRRSSAACAAIATFFLLTSCSRQQSASVPPASAPAAAVPQQTLVASVAASTTEAVEDLSKKFQAELGVEVKINAGPTNALASQILAGAPADVFLSASREWADKVQAGGYAAAQVDLLSNRLVAIVPKGNPAGVHKPEDLTADAVKKLALAGENVPAGMYADQALKKLDLFQKINDEKKIARGQDVRAALGYVERGEAEAGVVYATDARTAPGVEIAFEFDPALHEKIVYVLVLVKQDSENPAARRLYDFLQSSAAQQVFADRGFVPLLGGGTP